MHTDERAVGGEELDFVRVVGALWLQRWLVLGISLFVFLVSLAYVLLSRPVYEAKVYLVPPTQNEIANFNYGRISEAELSPYSVKDVYEVFLQNMRAESLRRDFFTTVYLPSSSEAEREESHVELYEKFVKNFTFEPVNQEGGGRYVFRVRADSANKAVTWAEEMVSRAGAAGRAEMISNVTKEAEVRARNLEQQIITLRENGRKVREDRIIRLREALEIAKAIKLENPPIISDGVSEKISADMSGDLIYMRGVVALQAEISNLESRSSDDPFLPDLRRLQVKNDFFQNLEVDPKSVAVYRVDGALDAPDSPVSPRPALILPLGLLAGLGLGFVVAFVRIFVKVALKQYATTRQKC